MEVVFDLPGTECRQGESGLVPRAADSIFHGAAGSPLPPSPPGAAATGSSQHRLFLALALSSVLVSITHPLPRM